MGNCSVGHSVGWRSLQGGVFVTLKARRIPSLLMRILRRSIIMELPASSAIAEVRHKGRRGEPPVDHTAGSAGLQCGPQRERSGRYGGVLWCGVHGLGRESEAGHFTSLA